MVTIGDRVRVTRIARGFSQRELAELCKPGATHAHVSRIESGERNPSMKALRLLARALAVTPEWLETGIDPPDVERARRALLVAARYLDGDAAEFAPIRKFLHRALVALDPAAVRGKVSA